MSESKHPDHAEDIDKLLGELPSGSLDEQAAATRAGHLAALAYDAADAALALAMRHVERGGPVPTDDPTVDTLSDSLVALEDAVRTYARSTMRSDGWEIAFAAVALKLGGSAAEWITGHVARIRALRQERVAALLAEN
jgi:hypothetical protein